MSRVVMFSGGAVSWGTAKRVADQHGTADLILLFCDTATEEDDLYRFVREGAAAIGGELVWLKDGRDVWDVMRDRRMIGNTRIAPCSVELKQKPARRWVEANCDPASTTLYVGIDWTEVHRIDGVRRNWAPYTVEFPLAEQRPYLSKVDVIAQIREVGLAEPVAYAEGRPHANCGGFCVRAGRQEFTRLLQQHPDRYAYHERREQEMRSFLGRDDISILRDRTGGTTSAVTLADFRVAQESGQMLMLDDAGGCGCFTGENR